MAANFRKKKCIVTSCLRSTDDGVKLHRCGENFAEIGKIVGKTGITKNTYICSLHFDNSAFSRKGGLKPKAVPTLMLEGPAEGVRRCNVPHCSNAEPNATMFKGRPAFQAVGSEIGADLSKGWICSEHFEQDCFDDRGRLKPGILPTLNFVLENSDGTLEQVTIRTARPENEGETSWRPEVEMMLSDDVVNDILDDCQEVEMRAENTKLRLQLRRAHEEIENLRRTVKLLQEDLTTKKRKIDNLEADLRKANSCSRPFEVRIVSA